MIVQMGVVVIEATKNQAAYNAGIRAYDIIVGINNKKVTTISKLQELLMSEHNPGDKVIVHYKRKRNSKAGCYYFTN